MFNSFGGTSPKGKQLEREKYLKITLIISKDKGYFSYFNSRPKSVLIAIIAALTTLATVGYVVQSLIVKFNINFF